MNDEDIDYYLELMKENVDMHTLVDEAEHNYTYIERHEEHPLQSEAVNDDVPLNPNAEEEPLPSQSLGLQDWRSVDSSLKFNKFSPRRARKEPSLNDILEHDGSLKLWWYDMYERLDKGCVYVFGKAGYEFL